MTDFRVVIPARLQSSRLPGKVLLDIAGRPMIERVWLQACASGATDVVVATDSDEVARVAADFGADVQLTSADCQSGTDRVAEVCRQRGWNDDNPVVNVQGDAPLMPPQSIRGVAELLQAHPEAAIATLCVAIDSDEEKRDPNAVKVVFDQTGRALYFSRSPIPAAGHDAADDASGWRHLGIYAYRAGPLQTLSATAPCELELQERLEQLRALWLGMEIRVAVDPGAAAPDVDTPEDLARVTSIILSQRD